MTLQKLEALADRLDMLVKPATPGPWGIWLEQINGMADRAIQELVDQVHNTAPIGNSLVMLDAEGKCPAITGCGPTSIANAALIVELVNNLPEILAALRVAGEGWQDISTAPRDEVIMRGWWFSAHGLGKSWECDIEYHDGTDDFVTHWRPLPAPPKETE